MGKNWLFGRSKGALVTCERCGIFRQPKNCFYVVQRRAFLCSECFEELEINMRKVAGRVKAMEVSALAR